MRDGANVILVMQLLISDGTNFSFDDNRAEQSPVSVC